MTVFILPLLCALSFVSNLMPSTANISVHQLCSSVERGGPDLSDEHSFEPVSHTCVKRAKNGYFLLFNVKWYMC